MEGRTTTVGLRQTILETMDHNRAVITLGMEEALVIVAAHPEAPILAVIQALEIQGTAMVMVIAMVTVTETMPNQQGTVTVAVKAIQRDIRTMATTELITPTTGITKAPASTQTKKFYFVIVKHSSLV